MQFCNITVISIFGATIVHLFMFYVVSVSTEPCRLVLLSGFCSLGLVTLIMPGS